jgi:hypothetical protein
MLFVLGQYLTQFLHYISYGKVIFVLNDAEREAEGYFHTFSTSRPYLFAVEERAFWIGG